ncbi:DUF6485 family protein [Natroniella sulfidigena]|uniref:DUF6485 family protein n=1 Tax=Natroniella sulfidigena TaxID=723921 RepID=UPI00200A21F3|nr:DUF6485 family protein [Natroniella sulfidigena]MCK8815890.1 DUF6485 family protein [Natroniella sulfidigena]
MAGCLEDNKEECSCTYEPCPRKGNCCACVKYHNQKDELPGCFFSKEAEKTYDRSVEFFIKSRS